MEPGVSVAQLYELLARTRAEILAVLDRELGEHREDHRRADAATVARARWAIATSLTALSVTVGMVSAVIGIISGGIPS